MVRGPLITWHGTYAALKGRPMPSEPEVLVHRTEAILRITFNRPAALNALTTEMLSTTAAAVEACAGDPAVRAVVVTGAGRAFSSGADLSAATNGPGVGTIDAANRLTIALRDTPKPIVAAVNGPAAGVGCSLALACDLTVAAQSAYFLLAFANIGLMPDGGATALVPAAVGRARANSMALLAERISASQALEWGLITEVVADDAFPAEVDALANRLASGPTAAYAAIKHAINQSTLARLPAALDTERAGQGALFDTADFAEGVAAFHAKRPPRFVGK